VSSDARQTSELIHRAAHQLQRGEGSAAHRLLRKVLAENPDPALSRGFELWRGNRPAAAAKALAEFSEQHPEDFRALQARAHIAMQAGAVDQAINLLQACLGLHPEIQAPRSELSQLLARRQRYAEALQQIDHLLLTDPGKHDFLMLKAALLDRSGQYLPAIEILQEILAGHSSRQSLTEAEQASIWTALGMIQRTLGDQAASVSSLQNAIRLDPSTGWSWFQLSDFKVYAFDQQQADQITQGLMQAKKGSMNEVHFAFAQGRALESTGDIDGAFAAYLRGNRVRAGLAPFDINAHRIELAGIVHCFNHALLNRPPTQEESDCPAIFVVGLPRSGTTLVDQVITAHCQVDGTMELPIVSTLVREFQQRHLANGKAPYPAAIAQMEPEELATMGREYLRRAAIQRGDAPYFVDKMPFNFQHIGLIRLMLPGARIVNVNRNPMALGFSIFRQLFRFGQDWAFDLRQIGQYYLLYSELMSHWDAVSPGLVTHILYESLVASPEDSIRQLLQQLGLPHDPACFKPHENKRPVRTASSEQVRKPMYTDSIDYWQRFEQHLEPLREALNHPENPTN
jgi:tetratricopeptide (TPR) repeat protein